jgi:hypothetical protein
VCSRQSLSLSFPGYNSVSITCVSAAENACVRQLIGFFNRDGLCLLRGTDWIIKYNSFHFFTALTSLLCKIVWAGDVRTAEGNFNRFAKLRVSDQSWLQSYFALCCVSGITLCVWCHVVCLVSRCVSGVTLCV